ncbi:hypothetical protein ACFSNO_07405 [Streptomyces cirratus]
MAANLRSRNVTSLSGELAAVTGTAGDTVLQFTDLHGDAGVALPLDPQKALSVADTDEYGNVREGTASARYNWLAAQQRDSGTPARGRPDGSTPVRPLHRPFPVRGPGVRRQRQPVRILLG